MIDETIETADRGTRVAGWMLVTLLALLPADAAGQGLSGEVGRFFDRDGWTAYRAAYAQPLFGPAGLQFTGNVFTGPGGRERTLWGAGVDLTLFQGGAPGLYAVGGVAGGFQSGGDDNAWGSWSAGLGYDWLSLGFLSLGTEARWRELSADDGREGLELSIRLGARWGSRRTSRPAEYPSSTYPSSTPVTNLEPGSAAAVRQAVIRTARAQLGTRYQYGGTGQGDQGFDCSGLIQYAYAAHGIQLPRVSRDQARAGRAVDRDLGALLPGDLLTFSNGSGGRVTHVGMYLGEGRFIHSASRGVQESRLSPDDPYGRWWWNRWVGARRIISP